VTEITGMRVRRVASVHVLTSEGGMSRVGWRRFLSGLAVAAAVAVAASAEAQTGKIAGIITDAESGAPIEGVQVHVQGTGYGAVTGTNGRYFIISVPPGTYTVQARRVGFRTSEQTGVAVRIDVTREINFQLSSAAGILETQTIVAEAAPLVEAGLTGSSQAISAEVIEALPVTDVSGVLALQQGFLEVPQNTDIVSFTDTRRNVLSPIRIRGGRAGETLTLVDGIPVNNIVFGGRAFDLTTAAVQQLDYQKGGFEPQYGNALSGIINIATREGGTDLSGNLEYQTTELGGTLGSEYDELKGLNLLRGFISGPVPGTSERLRFVIAGQFQSGADEVLEFDQDVSRSTGETQVLTRFNAPHTLDLFPGWRSFGYDNEQNIFAKVTFQFAPSSKLNLSFVDYERQRQPFDFDYLLTGFNPLDAPAVRTLEDTLGQLGNLRYANIVQGSIRADRQLYWATFEQRFGRSVIRLRGARFDQERESCNYFQGACLGARFADINFTERFVAPGISQGTALAGTDEFFGGESAESYILRADLESQVTDHHNLQTGVFFQQHDIVFAEARNLGVNDVTVVPQRYAAKPYDAAAYVQDRIEYDFLTVKLGFRFDYGKADGSGFADPLDPNNGTTAREVCEGTAPSLGATTPYTFTASNGQSFTGLAACNHVEAKATLLTEATALAQSDDFTEADARRAFSPRLGVSFPLTERSTLFFNAGRYTQNPLYNNLYQNTGIGTTAGPEQGICDVTEVKPNTNECYPIIVADAYTPAYIGNPNLLLEQATAYELGYASEIGRTYAIRATLFNKDESGLSGIKQVQDVFDIGNTYGTATPRPYVIVNQDFSTTRGLEVQFQRRVRDYWGFDINYSYSKSTTNAPPPDRQQQSLDEGDPTSLRELRSEIDQPHVFNTALMFRVGEQAPSFTLGDWLRNSYLTVTARAASGLPYTPTRSFTGFGDQNQGELYSARGPTTFQIDLLAGKEFRVANLGYGAFVRLVNLTDRKNCIQVYVTTGRCDAGVIDQSRARQGNSVGENVSSTYFDRPSYYGARRSIFAGVRVNF
jgi:outer membrane receptor protein involved in Fe transport